MKTNIHSKRSLLCLLSALIIGILVGCSRPFPTADNQKDKTDTVFLRNISEKGQFEGVDYTVWNKVFIDPDRHSPMYDHVLDFSDMEMYFADYDLKDLKHFDTSMLPDEWVPLYKYKGKYFIYRPGDSDAKFDVRDSLFISYFWEPFYFKIDSFKEIQKNHYRLQTKAAATPIGDIKPLYDIYIVDPSNSIAVWKQTDNKPGSPHYSLFVARENARKFPLIVNNANNKPEEFEFDPIDFEKLLKWGGFDISN